MKHKTYLILTALVFFPSALFSQYLGPEDIDIFINGFEEVSAVHDSASASSDGNWDNYSRQVSETFLIFSKIWEDDLFEEIDAFKISYAEFLNYKIPKELDSAYKSIGWKTDGHKKFFTLLFGLNFVAIEKMHAGPEDGELLKRMSDFFYKEDIALIRSRFDDIIKLVFI